MPTGIYPRHVKRHVVDQPLDADYRLIPLTKGCNAIVDVQDFEWLSQWNWCASWDSHTKSYRAVRKKSGTIVTMERIILNCDQGEESDHWNHDTSDNRRQNLRKTTRAQNSWNMRKKRTNSSRYTGVGQDKNSGRWYARVGVSKKTIHLGHFSSAEEAARVRDEAAKKYHGKFAQLNFPNP
jgi:AP2 domain